MNGLLIASVTALWLVVLANLLMTVRLARWVRDRAEERHRYLKGSAELMVGAPAPELQARTLDGAPVRLVDFAATGVAFVFVSPVCGPCRHEMPALLALAPLARAADGVELVLVSDASADETRAWVAAMANEDGVVVDRPMLVAPGDADFLHRYNPAAGTPYFVLVAADGRVHARGLLVSPEWAQVERRWRTAANGHDGAAAAEAARMLAR